MQRSGNLYDVPALSGLACAAPPPSAEAFLLLILLCCASSRGTGIASAQPQRQRSEHDMKFLKRCKSLLFTSILPLGLTHPSAQPAFSTRHGDVLEGILGLANMFHPTQDVLFYSSQLLLICICLHYLLGLFAGSRTEGSNSCWVLFTVLPQKIKNC